MTTALAPVDALPAASSAHPVDVYLASVTEGSRRKIRESLRTIARVLTSDATANSPASEYAVPWHLVRYEHAAAIRQALASRSAYSTVNRHLCALRGVLKACWRLRLMSAEDYYAVRSIESVTGERLPAGRAIGTGELVALLDVCATDKTAIGRRDAALLALLYGCGLRRAEVVGISVDDYRVSTGELRILGKRNKERLAHIADRGVEAALADWLALYLPWLDAHPPAEGADAPLLCHVIEGGRITGRRLTPEAINRRLAYRAQAAHVEPLTPHDFRRTFVGDLLDRGADIATVAKLAGHASVTTTSRYDRRPEEAKRKAAGLLHLPYRGVSD